MKRAWIRKVNGSRLANATDASSWEEREAPLCLLHSVPRLVSRFQMGGLYRTKICCNAWISACSIDDRAVRTRALSPDRRLCKPTTCACPAPVACRVRSMESTTLWTRSKTGGGVSACLADWSVACQVLLN